MNPPPKTSRRRGTQNPETYQASEHDIQSQIVEWLTLKRYFFYRQNSGAFKKGSYYVKFGYPGAPDILCVIRGQYVGLEVKDGKSEQSRKQKEFQYQLEKAGGRYYLCRSLQDAVDALK